MRFGISSVQLAMLVLSIAGTIACIRRRIWWMLIPVAYMVLAYFFTRTSYQPWLTIFAGLWYSLPYRAAECLCIFLMPVASLGLARLLALCTNFTARIPKFSATPQVGAAIVMILLVAITYPTQTLQIGNRTMHTPFASVAEILQDIYGNDSHRVYGAEEVAFVDKALSVIPEGALVINSPHDGSLFAYGVNHMNTYLRGTGIKHQSDDAILIRKHLCEYATNQEVKQAIERVDADYVLQLDQGVSYEDLIKLPQYYEQRRDKWAGIDKIRDDTPGFTLVLSEGDMRLYKIDR